MRTLAAAVLAVAPLLVLSVPADAKRPDRCRVVKDGTTIKRTKRVLVY